jgi:thiamine-phosphate pyrophosphorylase
MYPQIIDANINRIAEGLRVIEEYTRFVAQKKNITQALSRIRKEVNQSEPHFKKNLHIRDCDKDMRAYETPTERKTITELLRANFKRVEEALRVLEEYTGNPLYNRLRYDVYMLEKEIVLSLLKPPIIPGIYLISDDINILKKGIKHNVSLIQLRDKTSTKNHILEKAKAIAPIAKKHHIPLIINDHIDIALTVDADGFHSGQDDIPVTELRTILGPHKIIGRTTHTYAQGQKAKKEGADYISVGPIWETPSKPGRQGIGFNYLSRASKLNIPYVAIGNITPENYAEIARYTPPLIGIVRAHDHINELQKLHAKHTK